jgi:hypothetical protein
MPVLNPNVLTLADHAKRFGPDGKPAAIVELLKSTNPILEDMMFMEGNLPTGHRITMRTGLPTVYWRLINAGVPTSKSTTAQVDEHSGLLEAWSEVDVELAKLNGATSQFRMSEASAFIEAMNQEMAATVFYGNSALAPEEFTGLSPRYSSLSTAIANSRNVLDAGGTGSDNSSIWLIGWGDNGITGIFPKGSTAGLDHNDFGEVTAEVTTNSINALGGTRMRVLQERFVWKAGLALRDWRYIVRIANIDISDLDTVDAAALISLMTEALYLIPALGNVSPAFYMNRQLAHALDVQRRADVVAGGGITWESVDGRRSGSFQGIPVRVTDAILNTEARVV